MNKKFYGFLLGFAVLFGASVFQSCKDTSSDLETEIESLSVNVGQLSTDLEALKARVTTAEGNITTAQQTANNAQTAANNAQAAANKAQATADSIANVTTGLKSDVEKAQKTADSIANVTKELGDKLQEADSIAKLALDSATQVAKDLEALADKLEKEYATKDSLRDVAGSLDVVAGRVDDLETAVAELTSKVDSIDTALYELTQKVDSLEEAFNEFKRQPVGVTIQQVVNPIFGSFNTPVGFNTNILMNYRAEINKANDLGAESGYGFNGQSGTIYLSIDPATNDFSGVTPSLINSLGENSDVELSELEKSDKLLTFGVTTRAEETNYLYSTAATFNEVATYRLSLDVAGYKDAVASLIQNKGMADIKALGQLLVETIAANSTSLTAYGVEVPGEVNSVVSKYEVAALAIEPLTFDELDAAKALLASGVLDPYKDAVAALALKVVGYDLAGALKKMATVKIDPIKLNDIKIVDNVGVTVGTIEGQEIKVDPIKVSIPGISKLSAIQDLVSVLVDKAMANIPTVKEKIALLPRPVILAVDGSDIKIVSTNENAPTTISKDAMLFATSYCLETIVPYYMKTVNDVPVDGMEFPTQSGALKYKAVDYHGNTVSVTGYVTVK